ncbi:alpha/beta fold hydrolase [Cryobacterium tagatosivorans]|uniref:Alpha/beta hydrolase n=1 Tax=Cryobacterium tagatosivorans TaxID=1259199 RepID=A0A4R8UC17_9MICO|nr:hypothetical protein [Cryobacterium tagatosivorans]TFB47353.1 hypothetical protein E3O23_15185 [Cryobacterium tagatosivorans]
MARILHRVMTVELGYERYGAFGGDIGGTVAAWLGALFPDEVAGIHMIHPPFPADFDARPLTPAEEAFLASEEKYDESDGGYSAIMITRPDTIAAALNDSPIGLAAWIVDKLRDWSDCGGDLATRFDFDTILSMVIPVLGDGPRSGRQCASTTTSATIRPGRRSPYRRRSR